MLWEGWVRGDGWCPKGQFREKGEVTTLVSCRAEGRPPWWLPPRLQAYLAR